MPAFSSTVRRGDLFLMRLADWLVVLIAIVLPWSPSATAICIVAWLVVVLPTLDLASVRRELESAAGSIVVPRCHRHAVGGCELDRAFSRTGQFSSFVSHSITAGSISTQRAWHAGDLRIFDLISVCVNRNLRLDVDSWIDLARPQRRWRCSA